MTHPQKDAPLPALHRAILGVDIEGFADRRRINPDQVLIRGGLYRFLETAFARSGSRGMPAITKIAVTER